ncbi:hypothetical protein J437_LFUL004818 [Ladona fulva]|uniref:Cyclin-dependent kinase 2-interacting protein n=1 Tax=Ladona fulva TaxID=123851 RepID=A0A8K0K0W1_LADFU|nr:hypothetical protein J437_LFUL004818 [Ladona fulva]
MMCADSCLTPPRVKDDSVVRFSPVVVRESPVKKTPQRGNLTGNPRNARDLAADLYNLIQKWNSCHSSGADILAEIHQIKLTDIETAHKDGKSMYPVGLQDKCDRLERVCKEMFGIVDGMQKCAAKFKALGELEIYQSTLSKEGASSVTTIPMFLTWPPERFGEVASEIASRYSGELEVKNAILEGVCHTESREALMFHIAAWVHQPTVINEVLYQRNWRHSFSLFATALRKQ